MERKKPNLPKGRKEKHVRKQQITGTASCVENPLLKILYNALFVCVGYTKSVQAVTLPTTNVMNAINKREYPF